MASPNAFLSSPSGSARRRSHFFGSSSPALPSVQDILSQTSKKPPFLLGSKTTAILNDAKTLGRAAQNESKAQQPPIAPTAPTIKEKATLEIGDSSVSVIEISTHFVPKARKPRQKKEGPVKRRAAPKKSADSASPTKDQPRKKLKSKKGTNKKGENAGEKDGMTEPPPVEGEIDAKSTGTSDSPAPKAAKKSAKTKRDDINVPLQLEPATTRRLDWTPPSLKAPIVLDSDSPTPGESASSTKARETTQSFEKLLETYKCKENTRQDITIISDEDSSFLRKRKLIELVPTAVPNAPAVQLPEKSPMKQKAPKKKPRTITELATAAYRAQSPLESAPANASLANDAPNKATDVESGKTDDQGKSKAKPRKRASRAKKKPSPPPKPVLLPPSEALKEAANQDFVFGTSSQLAVENSPTFLRHLQAAMKQSNQLDGIDFETPLNSDAIDPPEQKPKMWEAGARDVDGDLFDLEMSRITARPSQSLQPQEEDDPFGYIQRDRENSIESASNTPPNESQDNDPFADLSDQLRSPDIKPLEIIDNDDPFLDSQISTGSPARRHIKSPMRSAPQVPSDVDTRPTKADHPDLLHAVDNQPGPPRPSYDLYTDAQLSKEITSYGFKHVKSRKAKIALLEQCWQSKAQLGQASIRTTATLSTMVGQASTAQGAATTPTKKPRGRPRKNSVNAPEAQEPPPSAQPPESPKRPRGRPKKDTTTSPAARARIPKLTKASKKLSEAPTTPKRKSKSKQVVIEIPDSASECGSSSSTTPQSSPEPTFSPAPPVDLSLSINDDTELSLTLDSSDDQSGLFNYITKAITSAPRTTDPSNPSWHEKILLYDPIILEDLTGWLNCGPLTRAGFDGEVSTSEVKKWCESKSVCCLWKVNLRGKERKRY